jgi:hypothetical protein
VKGTTHHKAMIYIADHRQYRLFDLAGRILIVLANNLDSVATLYIRVIAPILHVVRVLLPDGAE